MPPRNRQFTLLLAALVLPAMLLPAMPALGQVPGATTHTIRSNVDLVVVHATVINEKGKLITNLDQGNFRVQENGKHQALKLFRKETVPVTIGLVLDNSGSMAYKREQMMAAANGFVAVFNREDEFFVVNFNSDWYLDLERQDFTNDPDDVETAMERTSTRGSTAIFDALRASLDHIKKGTRRKKVIFAISDGVDTTSISDFPTLLEEVRESDVAFYFIQLPCTDDDDKSECRRAGRQMRRLADATGGVAYFPKFLGEIKALAAQIAYDIRSQYVLGYEPTNPDKDGTYRRLKVTVKAKGMGSLDARHRPGYYARGERQAARQGTQ